MSSQNEPPPQSSPSVPEAVKDETRSLEAEVIANLDMWYDAGKPFFTKEAMRDIAEQLKTRTKIGDIITIQALDGSTVELDVSQGMITATADEPDMEYVCESALISYDTIQRLRRVLYPPPQAYCSLGVLYTLQKRDKVTKEPVSGLPIESAETAVTELFRTSISSWKESETYKRFTSVLASANLPCAVQKVIGLACGSMSFAHRVSHRSAFQHALLLTARDLLQQKNTIPDEIVCYAQDPEYMRNDKSVLAESKIKVLNDPHAFLEIDDSSFVLSVSPNVPVRQIVADIARPAILVWNTVERKEGEDEKLRGHLSTDPNSPRVREMIRDYYDEFKFPKDEHFGDITIYIKRMNLP